MNFDDKLRELINEAEVPDELLPQNIAAMLKANAADTKTVKKNITVSSGTSSTAKKRVFFTRIAAACAACTVFAAGVLVYTENSKAPKQIEGPIDYEDLSPENYEELYDKYTSIYLQDPDENISLSDGSDISVTSTIDGSAAGKETETAVAEPIIPDSTDNQDDDYAMAYSSAPQNGISDADIVKSDEDSLYYIIGNTVYISYLDSMKVAAQIEKTDCSPFEMYIEGEKLILISRETEEVSDSGSLSAGGTDNNGNASNNAPETAVPAADSDTHSESTEINSDNSNQNSDSFPKTSPADNMTENENSAVLNDSITIRRTNIVVDIYDISSKSSPSLITSYKQNGGYTSSQMSDGILYLVTNYSNYSAKPLEKEPDLDSYVPAYYIDNVKYYVKAEDITIPADTANTAYTVISAIDCNAQKLNPTVKAVLGINKNVYCSADTLYLAGSQRGGSNKTAIVSFSLADGIITYKAGGSVDGKVFSGTGMNEYNGMLRAAARVQGESVDSVSVYTLNSSLEVTETTDKLLEGENVTGVKFSENYVSFMVNNEDTAALIFDLTSNSSRSEPLTNSSSAYLCKYDDSKLLGLGIEYNEAGVQTGLSLTMFDTESGLIINSVVFADDTNDAKSKAFTDRRAFLADSEKGIIAVPVYSHNEFGTKNQYYVYSYDDSVGFTVKGIIEYNDIDDSCLFERAVISDDVFYAIANGRVVAAQLTDLKVIESYTF